MDEVDEVKEVKEEALLFMTEALVGILSSKVRTGSSADAIRLSREETYPTSEGRPENKLGAREGATGSYCSMFPVG